MSRDASDHASLPAGFGPYRVEREIGTGVLGPVLQARESKLDRVVAVKAFVAVAGDRGAAAFGRALTSITASGLAHPSIVQPLAAGVEEGVPFLASELVVGDSLDAALARYGPAPAADTARLVAQIAAALDAARSVGLVHGRLNPRDLLVTPELVRVTGAGVAAALEACGLPSASASAYAAPERVAGRAWDHRADVYSMAAIAWELLTGRRLPPSGTPLAAEEGDVEVARPEKLREVLAQALAEDPAVRFESARDFASALEVALTGRVSRVTPPAGAVTAAADEPASDRHARRRPARAPRERSGHHVPPRHRDEPSPDRIEAGGGASVADQVEQAAARAERPADAAHPAPTPAVEAVVDSRPPGLAPAPAATPQAAIDLPAAPSRAGLAPTPASIDAAVWVPGGGADDSQAPAPPTDRSDAPTPEVTDAQPVVASESAGAEPLDLPLAVASEGVPADLPFGPPGAPAEPAEPVIVRPGPSSTVVGRGEGRRRPTEPVPVFLQNKPSGRANTPDPVALSELYGPATRARSPRAWMVALVACGVLVGFAAGYWTGTRLAAPTDPVEAAADREAGAASSGLPLEPATPGASAAQAAGAPAASDAVGRSGGTPGDPGGVPRPVPALADQKPAAPASATAPAVVAPPASAPAASPPKAETRPAREATVAKPAGGRLTVRSTPPGATVIVNGDTRGRTPVTLSGLPFRAFTVRLTLEGYQPYRRQVSLSAARPSGAMNVTLRRSQTPGEAGAAPASTPKPTPSAAPTPASGGAAATSRGAKPAFRGTVSIDSKPSGAQVFLDNKPVGMTPLVLEDVAAGSHVVRVERSGFKRDSKAVQVVAGRRISVSFVLDVEPPR